MMRYIATIAIMALVIAGACICNEADAGDGPYIDDYCTAEIIIGDKTVGFSISIVGMKTVGQAVAPFKLPDGYIGWDHDLDEVLYEDTVIRAVPAPDAGHMPAGTAVALVLIAILAIAGIVSLGIHKKAK